MSESAGRVETIWIKRAKRGPMDVVPRVRAVAGRGLEGNANQGGKRQVTLLSADSWSDVVEELGEDVDPSLRRSNLYLRGIDLRDSRGKTLSVGGSRIRIYGETRPCNQMEESRAGLQAALDPGWRGGAYGEVLEGGEIAVGDAVSWVVE
jgi:MOSC domain-containing protein YiiM